MIDKIIDLVSLFKGSRFALTFLDFNKKDEAINDEVMIDKEDPQHQLYYRNKSGNIVKIGGDPNVKKEDLDNMAQDIKNTLTESKEYTEAVFAENGGSGSAISVVRYEYSIDIIEDDVSEVQIPLSTYGKKDFLLVSTNSILPSPEDAVLGYTVSDTGMITFNTPLEFGHTVYIVIIKNIPTGDEGSIDGNLMADGSILESKLSEQLLSLINSDKVSDGAITKLKLSQEVLNHIEKVADDKIHDNINIKVSDVIPPNIITGEVWFKVKN